MLRHAFETLGAMRVEDGLVERAVEASEGAIRDFG
jgi:hypothetical protein